MDGFIIGANVGKAEDSQKQLLTQTHLHLYHFKLDWQTIFYIKKPQRTFKQNQHSHSSQVCCTCSSHTPIWLFPLSATFSETEAKPLVGCWVLKSKVWNFPSSDVATSLFMLMFFLSNSTQHTCTQHEEECQMSSLYHACRVIKPVTVCSVRKWTNPPVVVVKYTFFSSYLHSASSPNLHWCSYSTVLV